MEEFLFHTFLSLGDGGVVRSTETCADLAQGKGGVAPAQDNRQRPRRMSVPDADFFHGSPNSSATASATVSNPMASLLAA